MRGSRELRGRVGRTAVAALIIACSLALPASIAAAAATPAGPPPAREQLTIAPDAANDTWTGDLDGMVERKTIRVLTTYSKTFYFLDKATQRGLVYDAFRLFEDDLNKRLKRQRKLRQRHVKVQVVFIPVARDELLPALAAGRGDIAAANLTITPERQQLVDFTAPVYRDVSELVVSGPRSPAVSVVEDLSGKEVFVRRSSSYYESLVALNQRLAARGKAAVVLREAPETLEDEDLLEMVNAGLIPLVVVDKHKADFWKQVFPKIRVHDGVAVRTGGATAWAIRKGSPQLKADLDAFIARNGVGTATGNTIGQRYFKSAKYVKDAASEAERRKFLSLVQFFQKYGDRYDVDWLLVAAQGYQESRLDQAARSKSGAIGVMQVMPATGKSLGVGDISQVEPNIHAGTKYLRFMIDEYFGGEPMTALDKALFAFAAYNAGPNRVEGLRREAARRKLDPNIWFRNVEYVAAEKIGAETVTYVANIYKYYIAYRLITEGLKEKKRDADRLKSGID